MDGDIDLKDIHTVFEVDLMDPAPPGPKPNRCCGYNVIGDAGIDHHTQPPGVINVGATDCRVVEQAHVTESQVLASLQLRVPDCDCEYRRHKDEYS